MRFVYNNEKNMSEKNIYRFLGPRCNLGGLGDRPPWCGHKTRPQNPHMAAPTLLALLTTRDHNQTDSVPPGGPLQQTCAAHLRGGAWGGQEAASGGSDRKCGSDKPRSFRCTYGSPTMDPPTTNKKHVLFCYKQPARVILLFC